MTYGLCCAPIHDDPKSARSPEALMRSRYSAFVLQNEAHLLATWHPATRPTSVTFDPNQRWLGLKILRSGNDQVEFVARYKVHGKGHRLRETSRFEQADGGWYYVDGEVTA